MNMRSYKEITDIGKYPDLQSALDDVEFALEQRPNLAVQSMRVAVEIMLKNLCRQHFGQEGEDNSTRLKMLKEGNIVSGTLNDRLHQLRILGNEALHDNFRIEAVDARMYYNTVLELARFYVAESDPTGALNRGIRVDMHTSIVTPFEEITDLGTMTKEERTRIAENTVDRLRHWIEGWKQRSNYIPEHVWRGSFDVDYPWNGWDAFEIPVCVQEYFIEYHDGLPVQRISRIKMTHMWFECQPIMFCDYVQGIAPYTDRIVIPSLVKGAYLTQELDLQMESEVTYDRILTMDYLCSPSLLRNMVFCGDDLRGSRGMYLVNKEIDLELPDDFEALKLPEDIRILLIYFPRMRTVTCRGETWETKDIIAEDARRYLDSGLMRRNLRITIPSGKLMFDHIRQDRKNEYILLPQKLTETRRDAIYYLFTLRNYYNKPDRQFGPCPYTDPEVRKYIGSIQGEPVQWIRKEGYPSGLHEGISYNKSSIRSDTDFTVQRRFITRMDTPIQHFMVLPDWVFEGALALHTDVEEFLNAVLKVRPELLDVDREPEPLPEEKPVPEAKPLRPLNFCPYCGKKVKSEAAFCIYCGKKLPR